MVPGTVSIMQFSGVGDEMVQQRSLCHTEMAIPALLWQLMVSLIVGIQRQTAAVKSATMPRNVSCCKVAPSADSHVAHFHTPGACTKYLSPSNTL